MSSRTALRAAILAAALLVAPHVRADITSNLVGYWKLDESSGTNAADSSGNNNTATLQGGATWTTGNTNNGVQLKGTNQYVRIPSNTALQTATTAVSVGLWTYRTATVSASMISRQVGTGANEYFNLAWSGDKLHIWMNSSGSATCTNPTTTAINTWVHVGFTWNGSTITSSSPARARAPSRTSRSTA